MATYTTGDSGSKETKMLELKSGTELVTRSAGSVNRQQLRLLIALSLLLIALGVVLIKNRDFWLGSDETLEFDANSAVAPKSDSSSAHVQVSQTLGATAVTAKKRLTAKTSAERTVVESALKPTAGPDSPVVVTKRAVLPPLDIEVVAGDTHRTVHAGSNAAKVEILSDSNHASASTTSVTSGATNASERERLSAASVSEVRSSEVRPSIDVTYPLLGQHMQVQGSVVLQAVVGTDGNIEDLRVLSGPAILTAAAQQAVRQWRFKPYLQNGQPVETKAKITVNFSIRVSDNPAKTS
jgi:TonB family protein